ncbi:MAG: Ig-like domain-containing protein [Pseudomonadota bacterium]
MKYHSERPAARDGVARLRPRRSMLALESRIVFDGAVVAAVIDIAKVPDGAAPDHSPDAVAPDAPATPDSAAPGKVLIVDTRVADYQQIVAAAGAGVTVILIGKDSDGIMQIADALKGMHELDSISIVSHGDDGMLLLGDAALVGGDLGRYSAELTAIGASLKEHGEILLFGCDAGRGEAGRAFLDGLAAATGAVIAASGDATGGASRGGDWDLEIATGAIRSTAAFDASGLENYDHLLVTTAVSTLAQLNAAIATGGIDNVNDTITLTADITFTGANDTILVSVGDGHTMTIVGAGHVIDGAYQTRVFNTFTTGVNSAIEIQNLTIQHGAVSGAGGSRNVAGGSAFGGGIVNTGTLTLNGVTLSQNVATGGGGGGGGYGSKGTGGGGGSGASGVGGARGGNSAYYAGASASAGNGGQGGNAPGVLGGFGGTSSGGGPGGAGNSHASGGNGASVFFGQPIGGGGGGAGFDRAGADGGGAAGAIYNSGTLTIVGTSAFSGNIAAGGGGGGSGSNFHGGLGGRGVGAIWNASTGIVRITASNYSAIGSNGAVSGAIGGALNGSANNGWSSPFAENRIFNEGGTLDTAFIVVPTVTDSQISITGASGLGAYKVGDTVSAFWNNSAGGPSNTNVTSVKMDFSQFGGGAAVTATNFSNVWRANYTLTAGSIDATGRNVSVTATNPFGSTTAADTSNATVDNIPLTVTNGNLSISGATGTGGAYKIGDTVTATWNNTAGGDNNSDTLFSANTTFNFSQFGGSSFVTATNNSGLWTASYTLTAGAIDGGNRNVSFSATDNAGNFTSTFDTTNATVDNVAPAVTDARISISGGSGTGGAYKIGDTVTATWNNTAGGDNNSDTISGATIDFSQFGGGAAVAATNSAGTWTASTTLTAGAIDAINRNVSVTASDNAGNTRTTADTTNATVDNIAPTVTDGSIGISGGSGVDLFRIGDTVTATWDNTASGDNNGDTISSVTVDFSQFGGTITAASDSSGLWTAAYTLLPGVLDGTSRNVIFIATDNEGNITTTADTTNATVDSTAATSDIAVADSSLLAGETSLVTITFSEAVNDFTNADLTISNGTLSTVSSADGGITWTATLTPDVSMSDITNLITLDNSGVQDVAGNAGSGTTDSNNYAVDTIRPTASIVVADNALAVGETSLVTITFSEAVTGFANVDLSIANGTLSTVSSFDGGITWTATLTPTASITDAINVITLANAGVQNAAGNAGSGTTASNNYEVDTARPTAGIVVADSSLLAGETSLVTITFSEAVTGFDNADLTVATGTLGTVSSSDGGITWSAVLTPPADITDTNNTITLDNTGVQDAAGNAGSGSTDSNNYAIATVLPTATVVVADSALNAGETSLVTITFSEAVTGFSNSDLIVENGTLSTVSSADGGITWTATLTPTADVTDAINVITLANTGVQNAAGNAGSGTTDSGNYAVSSVRPTASIVIADNALAIGETSLVTITFSEAVTDFANADLSIANGTLGTVSSSDGGITWSATLTPTASITDAINVITLANAGVQNAAGNAGSGTTASNNYEVDTARPTAGIVVADSSLLAGETSLVTITFSEAVTGFDNADLTVATGTLGTVSSSDGGITWSALLTPTADITDTGNLITLDNTGVQDAAGNAGSGSTDSNNYTIATVRPTAAVVVADSALVAGQTSLVTITFSEAVTGFANVDLTIANGTLSTVSSADGGITWTATLTPDAGFTGSSNVITLDTGGLTNAAGNAGTGATVSNNYAIDTALPTATIVVADSSLVAGETSLVTITFSEAVTGFANADLTVANGTLSAVSSSDGGITWTATLTPTASVTDTNNVITLANTGVQDAAGNAGSGTTDSDNYAIDTTRPTAGIVVADNELAVGETSLVTITFSEAVTGFANVNLTVANGTLSAVSSADGGITWTAILTPTAGINATSNLITLDHTDVQDAAGNAGAGIANSNNYTLDSTSPTAFIDVTDNALAAGETSLVTITFSEAVAGFTNADLTIANGSLSAVSSADGGITWTATLTPTDSIAAATNFIALDNAGVQDVAGNAGSGTTDSNNYAVATVRPTASIVVADSALTVGESALVTITFSDAVTGFTNADLTVDNGSLSDVSSADGGITWTAILTPVASINDTSNVIVLDSSGVQDAAGNAGIGSTNSNNYAVNTASRTVDTLVTGNAPPMNNILLMPFTITEASAPPASPVLLPFSTSPLAAVIQEAEGNDYRSSVLAEAPGLQTFSIADDEADDISLTIPNDPILTTASGEAPPTDTVRPLARLSGMDLLVALGLGQALAGESDAHDDGAPPESDTRPAHAPQLSEQFVHEARRFVHGSSATLDHLGEIEQSRLAALNA